MPRSYNLVSDVTDVPWIWKNQHQDRMVGGINPVNPEQLSAWHSGFDGNSKAWKCLLGQSRCPSYTEESLFSDDWFCRVKWIKYQF